MEGIEVDDGMTSDEMGWDWDGIGSGVSAVEMQPEGKRGLQAEGEGGRVSGHWLVADGTGTGPGTAGAAAAAAAGDTRDCGSGSQGNCADDASLLEPGTPY